MFKRVVTAYCDLCGIRTGEQTSEGKGDMVGETGLRGFSVTYTSDTSGIIFSVNISTCPPCSEALSKSMMEILSFLRRE